MRFPNQNPEVFRVRQERGTSIDKNLICRMSTEFERFNDRISLTSEYERSYRMFKSRSSGKPFVSLPNIINNCRDIQYPYMFYLLWWKIIHFRIRILY